MSDKDTQVNLTVEGHEFPDMVNHPPHYTSGNIECIDAVRASMSDSEYAGFLKGQVLKYMWRYDKKAYPIQDLKKAGYYLNKLTEFVEERGIG